MAFCPKCGAQVSDTAKFCSKCGQPMSAPANTPTVPLTPDSAPTMPLTPPQANAAQAAPVINNPSVAPVTPSAAPTAARQKKQLPRWAIIALVVVVVAAAWWFFIRKDPVKGLKNHVFQEYGTAPFSTVVDTVLPGAKWSSSGNTVTVSGAYMMVPFTMTFQVSYMGSVPVVQFLYASAMGEQETDADDVIGSLYEMYADKMPSYSSPSASGGDYSYGW